MFLYKRSVLLEVLKKENNFISNPSFQATYIVNIN